MIKFLLKGILRDKRRSVLPVVVVTIGVMLTVALSGYLRGVMGDVTDQNARFQTGHVKIVTRAYAENADQLPLDLALLGVDSLVDALKKEHPDMEWVERIRFGGLVDAPDENGNSEGQGPGAGLALDLFSPDSKEAERMNIASSMVRGKIPAQPNEAILSDDFAQKLKLEIGDEITFFGSTMNGSMTFQNFRVSGTVKFGAAALDRGSMIIDISDARRMLDMEDGVGEILGYLPKGVYNHESAQQLAEGFNACLEGVEDEFAPTMQTLKEQNNLGPLIDYANSMSGVFVFVFVLAMSVVLWNTGLLGGLRRYREFGIRLALGESKGMIFRSLVMEAVLIGIIGSIIGTLLGLSFVFYLQTYGFDMSQYMENSSMLMPSVVRARVTPDLFFIGFIPGLVAMVLGNMLSGRGIYKRETARLFKELEV